MYVHVCACAPVHTNAYMHKGSPWATATGVSKLPNVGAGNHTAVFWLKEEHNKSILLCEPVGNQDFIVGNYVGAERLNSLTPLKCCEAWYSGKLAFGHWPLELNVWMSPWSCYFSQSKESWQSVSTQRQRVLSYPLTAASQAFRSIINNIGKTYRYNFILYKCLSLQPSSMLYRFALFWRHTGGPL